MNLRNSILAALASLLAACGAAEGDAGGAPSPPSSPPPSNPGTIALGSANLQVGQAAGNIGVTVSRSGGSAGAASVTYATTSATATAGSDYTVASGTLSWSDGEASVKTVPVPIINTTGFDGSRTFTFTLSGPAGATLGSPAAAVVTITGRGAPPVPAPSGSGAAGSVTVASHILVDQFGYRPGDSKVAVIRSPEAGYDASNKFSPGTAYEVRKADDGSQVFAGAITAWNGGATQASSGDKGWWFDFSALTAPGNYYVYDVQRGVRSPTFRIQQDVYKPILKAAMKMFYFQRSGMAKVAPYAGSAGEWADSKAAFVGPNQDLVATDVTDSTKHHDLSGGWFDAGDTNQYVTYANPVVHQLLTAYQNNADVFTDDFNIPESGNGIPDVLDEVKWETDWLKKMQYGYPTDGGVALKLGKKNFDFASPPSRDASARFYVPACTSSTIAAAGMFAHAAYVYDGITSLKTEAAALKARAISAWNNYQSASTKQTDCDNQTVKAGDADWTADFQKSEAVVAAIYLYAATGEAVYGNYVKTNYRLLRPYNDAGWTRYDAEQGEALLFYTTLANADATLRDTIRQDKQSDVNAGGGIYGFGNDDLYRAYLHDGQYHWGSNQPRANYGNTNVDALKYLSGLDAGKRTSISTRAVEILHYFHGVNPFGTAYLTNMKSYGATSSINAIFHSWFHVKEPTWGDVRTSTYGPPPGFIPGGPNGSSSANGIGSDPLQKRFRDWNGDPVSGDPSNSYEITEPGIYYQVAYVKLVSAFAK